MRISDWSSDVCSSNLVSGDVGASVELHAEAFDQALGLRSEEAHGQEHELALDLLVAALDLLEAAVDHPHLVEAQGPHGAVVVAQRSEEHTSELQSLMRISYAVSCLITKTTKPEQ